MHHQIGILFAFILNEILGNNYQMKPCAGHHADLANNNLMEIICMNRYHSPDHFLGGGVETGQTVFYFIV